MWWWGSKQGGSQSMQGRALPPVLCFSDLVIFLQYSTSEKELRLKHRFQAIFPINKNQHSIEYTVAQCNVYLVVICHPNFFFHLLFY